MAIKQWADLCREAGLPIRELDLMDIYLAGGAIARKLREFQGAPGDFSKLTQQQQADVFAAAYAAVVPKHKAK
jgi:hypothetical protein